VGGWNGLLQHSLSKIGTRWFYRLLVHKGGDNVRIIIEARLEDGKSSAPSESVKIAVIDRADEDLEQLGLTLEEGRDVLAAIQSVVVSRQAAKYLGTQDYRRRCYTPFNQKDRLLIGKPFRWRAP
jgi:hypothetical protein